MKAEGVHRGGALWDDSRKFGSKNVTNEITWSRLMMGCVVTTCLYYMVPTTEYKTEQVADILKVHHTFMPDGHADKIPRKGRSEKTSGSHGVHGSNFGNLYGDVAVKMGTFQAHGGTFPEYLRSWVKFAADNDCSINTGYQDIIRDLEPFKAKGLSRKLLKRTDKILDSVNYCVIRAGRLKCSLSNSMTSPVPPNIDKGMLAYAKLLPDMDFVLNTQVSPRVMLPSSADRGRVVFVGPGVDKGLSRRCSHESGVLAAEGKHSVFIQTQPSRTSELMPLLSPYVVDGCFTDINIPNWERRSHTFSELDEQHAKYVSWGMKNDAVTWHGKSTGADIREGENWEGTQRFRLVRELNKPNYFGLNSGIDVDVAFDGEIVQCSLIPQALCQDLCDEYRCARTAPVEDMFKSKYILDVDGNAASQRFMHLMLSGSVILKSTVYRSWWNERAEPWVHYVPIDINYNNLNETVQWLYNNDDKAEEIAAAGRKLALTRLRDIDVDCYTFRLLLEYNALFVDDH